MDAEHGDVGRRHGLVAAVAIPMEDGSGVATATVSASTPALVVLGVIGAVVMAGVMLTRGSWPLQDAGLALVEHVGGRLLAAA